PVERVCPASRERGRLEREQRRRNSDALPLEPPLDVPRVRVGDAVGKQAFFFGLAGGEVGQGQLLWCFPLVLEVTKHQDLGFLRHTLPGPVEDINIQLVVGAEQYVETVGADVAFTARAWDRPRLTKVK